MAAGRDDGCRRVRRVLVPVAQHEVVRPVCACHGVEMRLNTDKRYTGGFYWRCKVKDNEQCRRYMHERMPFELRAKRHLDKRRRQALTRRRERRTRETF